MTEMVTERPQARHDKRRTAAFGSVVEKAATASGVLFPSGSWYHADLGSRRRSWETKEQMPDTEQRDTTRRAAAEMMMSDMAHTHTNAGGGSLKR